MSNFQIADSTDSEVHLKIISGDLNGCSIGKKVFDSGSVWQFYKDGNDFVFRLETPLHPSHPYRVARFDEAFRHGELILESSFLNTELPVYPLEHPMDHLVVNGFLSKGNGVALHSCGLAVDGVGFLFPGQSGAGKTTTAKLWAQNPDIKILSDERTIVRQIDGKIWLYGSPWPGDGGFALNERTQLSKVFFLRQWTHNEVVPLRGAEAAARFFACSFPPFYSTTGLDFTLAFFDTIVNEVPCYELRFVPQQSSVDLVRAMW